MISIINIAHQHHHQQPSYFNNNIGLIPVRIYREIIILWWWIVLLMLILNNETLVLTNNNNNSSSNQSVTVVVEAFPIITIVSNSLIHVRAAQVKKNIPSNKDILLPTYHTTTNENNNKNHVVSSNFFCKSRLSTTTIYDLLFRLHYKNPSSSIIRNEKENIIYYTTTTKRIQRRRKRPLLVSPSFMNSEHVDFINTDNDITDLLDERENNKIKNNNHNSNNNTSHYRWKKKRYFMMKDVQDTIIKNPSLGVTKAVDMMNKWWKFSMMNQNSSSNNNNTDDDVNSDDDDDDDSEYYKPTLAAYHLWIHAVAKCGSVDCGYEAERIIKEILPKYDPHLIHQINIITYTNIMDAYAQQSKLYNDKQAAQNAERILFEWLDQYEWKMKTTKQQQQQQHQLLPLNNDNNEFTLTSTNAAITSFTCDTVLNAWAQLGTWEGATRAEEILKRLEQYSNNNNNNNDGNDNNNSSSNNNNNNNNNNNINNNMLSVHATEHSYAAVIHGWATCGGGGKAAERATAILERMLRKYKSDNNKSRTSNSRVVRPDTVIFNACINAWATSQDPRSGTKALQLLNKMRELNKSDPKNFASCAPDTVTYNTVLSAWSHSGHVNAAPAAEKVLQQMIIAHRDDPVTQPEPCTVGYNSVLHAWSKSQLDGSVQRAETILNYMIKQYNTEGECCKIAPDIYSFTSVLDALAKSKDGDKAVRANAILGTMLLMYKSSPKESLKPTVVPFNAVLNAAAFSALGTSDEQKREALQIAVSTFTLMRSPQYKGIVHPDSISYGTIIKAFSNLMPRGKNREDMAIQIFDTCCRDGYVNNMVWTEFRRALRPRCLNEHMLSKCGLTLTEIENMDLLKSIPREWFRNIRVKRDSKNTGLTKNTNKQITKNNDTNRSRRGKEGADSKVQEKQKEKQIASRRRGPVKRFRSISEPSYESGRNL